MKKYVKITIAVAVLTAIGNVRAYAQEVQPQKKGFFESLVYTGKVGIGWSQIGKDDSNISGYSSEIHGGLAMTAGFSAEMLDDNENWGLSLGIEYNIKRHILDSNYGGITGSSDFIDKVTYTAHYLSVPLLVNCHHNWFPFGIGFVSNYALFGKRSHDITGTGISTATQETSNSIKNFNSPVWSLRIVLGDKKSLYGFTGECDIMLGKNYENTAFKRYWTTTVFYNF